MTNAVTIISIGLASWFHPHRTTAHGHLVCDSRVYAKGTLLKITERHNGSQVVVVVDDFGPRKDLYHDGVIVDLCPEAFEKLDGKELGRAEITLEVLL